jgi:glycosyltransferase involved in cell wall biosynthesis
LNEASDGSGTDARPRIALVAYVCGPDEGSEPGTGWAWARMLATFADVTLITIDEEPRASRTDERIAALGLADRIRHVAVPYPRWWPRLFHRFGRFSYMAWHLGMVGPVRRLGLPFDLAWHVTLANVWMGSAGFRLARRFVFGPVGGGVPTPWGVAPALGPWGILFEVNRTIARTLGRWANPLGRAAWTRAELILAQNPETVAWLPASVRGRTVIFPHVVLEGTFEPPGLRVGDGSYTGRGRAVAHAITVGRLLPWKGIALAIRSMTHLPGWQLTVVGEGPDRARLERLARDRGVADRVEFAGWLERHAVQQLVHASDVLLFPSLHEEGGWAAAEAAALGVPVVALDRGGPAVLGARTVPATTPERTARAIAAAALKEAAAGDRPLDDRWVFERQRDALVDLLRERGLLSTGSAVTDSSASRRRSAAGPARRR